MKEGGGHFQLRVSQSATNAGLCVPAEVSITTILTIP